MNLVTRLSIKLEKERRMKDQMKMTQRRPILMFDADDYVVDVRPQPGCHNSNVSQDYNPGCHGSRTSSYNSGSSSGCHGSGGGSSSSGCH
jgi:hypothetical protein